MSDSKLPHLLIGAVAGVVLAVLATAFYWTHYERQLHLQVLTVNTADRSASLIPLLISLEEDPESLQVAARNQLISGIAIMDANAGVLDNNQKEMVLPVLESIAAKRSRVKIGKYATPPQPATEEILAKYDR